MWKSALLVFGVALLGAGCASPERIESNAMQLQSKAQMYRTIGEYDRAARTQDKADQQFAKAAYRRQQMVRYGL